MRESLIISKEKSKSVNDDIHKHLTEKRRKKWGDSGMLSITVGHLGEISSARALGVSGWKGIGLTKPITNGRPMYTRGGHGGEVSLHVVLTSGGGSGKWFALNLNIKYGPFTLYTYTLTNLIEND